MELLGALEGVLFVVGNEGIVITSYSIHYTKLYEFMSLIQMLATVFGDAGRFISVIILILQLTAFV